MILETDIWALKTAIIPFSPRKVRDFCCCTEKYKQIKKFYNYDTIQFKEVDIQRWVEKAKVITLISI